jgi:hypothetical protein
MAHNHFTLRTIRKKKRSLRSQAKNISHLLVSQLNTRNLTPIEKHKLKITFNLSYFEAVIPSSRIKFNKND